MQKAVFSQRGSYHIATNVFMMLLLRILLSDSITYIPVIDITISVDTFKLYLQYNLAIDYLIRIIEISIGADMTSTGFIF